MKKLALLLAVSLLAVSAFAQSPVGAWKGKVKIDTSAMPKVTDPQQKAMMDKMLAQIQSLTISLNVKAAKTYTVTVPAAMGQPGQSEEGTWTQKGNVVTLTTTKKQGKAVKGDKPKNLTLSADGKKMTMVAGNGPQKATVTFSK